MKKRSGLFWVRWACVCVAAFAACAQSVGDIDRTQPNVVRKSLFEGVWYYRETVIDVPATSSFTFVGETGEMEKIRWEVQEDKLIAYRAYELVPGTDVAVSAVDKAPGSSRYRASAREGRTPDAYKENPVAAFAIQKHFDVTRSYNPQTGEQSNVLTENDSDRPWYQRAFMRVDWSKNLVVNFKFLSTALSASPVAYVQQNEGGEDAFYMEDEAGARVDELRRPKALGYFDFTTKVFVEPSEEGCILAFWYGEGYEDCTAGELKLRHSFAKQVGEREYEPMPYSDRDQAKFGYFRTERVTYNRERGATESGRIFLANRHAIWKQVWTKGPNGEKIPIPFAEREPKPIVYYLSKHHPIQLLPSIEATAKSWNRAFKKAVALAQGKREADVPEMFRIDLNGYLEFPAQPARALANVAFDESRPSERWANGNRLGRVVMRYTRLATDTDETLEPGREPLRCAEFDAVGTQKFYAECVDDAGFTYDAEARKWRVFTFHEGDVVARFGDVRRNIVHWVDSPQLASPWGYGPSSSDPESGEIISGMAYVYGAPTDLYATQGMEIVKLLNGKLKLQDLVDGTNVRDEIMRHLDRADPRGAEAGSGCGSGGGCGSGIAGTGRVSGRGRADFEKKIFGRDRAERRQQFRQNGFPLAYRGWLEDRMRRAKDKSFANFLMNQDEVKAAAGVNPLDRNREVTARQKEKMSSLVHGLPTAMKKRKARLAKALRNNVTLAEFVDDSMLGLALEFAQKYGAAYETARPEDQAAIDREVWGVVRERIYRAVMEHEIGHTLGLRHNFQGSFDSLNYFDDYWTLRRETLAGPEGGDGRNAATSSVVFDGTTLTDFNYAPGVQSTAFSDAQKRGKMREFQYSTVMDYGARFNSDIHGTGRYDDAAIVYAYTGATRVAARGDVKSEAEMFPTRVGARRDRFFCADGNQAAIIGRDAWRCVEPGFVETFKALPATYAKLPNLLGTFNDRPAPIFHALTEVLHYSQLPYLLGGGKLQGICADGEKCDVCFVGDDNDGRGSSALSYEGFYAFRMKSLSSCDRSNELWLTVVEGGDATRGIAAMKDREWKRASAVRGGRGGVEVPYLFCSDEYVGAMASCNLWDMGADALEVTRNALESYESQYFFSHFKRDRFGFSPWDVMARILERDFSLVTSVYQSWLLTGDAPGMGVHHYNLDAMGVFEGFNALMGVLTRPRYGTFVLAGNEWAPCSYTPNNQDCKLDGQGRPTRQITTVKMGAGRRLYTRYDYASGYNLFDKTLESGHFWDFLAALFAIADSEGTVVGVDTASDMRTYLLSYYLMFEKELTKFYNGIVLDDGNAVGARLSPQSDGYARVLPSVGYDFVRDRMAYDDACAADPNAAGCSLAAPLATLKPVRFSSSWDQQLYATYLGMAGFSEMWTLSFVDQAKVFRLGAGEGLEAGAGHTIVQFTDPKKGVKYAALKKNGVTDDAEKTLAVRLVERGKALYDAWQAAADEDKAAALDEISYHSDYLDILRGMANVYGEATW
ncbi:MAG: zinc-dependent metalloprotease [Deltaproteobacteria bacterium]|nr:zinc-dependent metalloprotease [Deltaproteobacteria bacterium]